MTGVGELPKFKYHTRCGNLKLNHLCFVDDLLMFYKGDKQVVQAMIEAFMVFSNTNGLTVNANKSSIFCCGMDNNTKEEIKVVSGFRFGELHFRYISVPISNRKLKASECEQLINKIVPRIKIWSTRELSFVGRIQLVNSVVMSISVY